MCQGNFDHSKIIDFYCNLDTFASQLPKNLAGTMAGSGGGKARRLEAQPFLPPLRHGSSHANSSLKNDSAVFEVTIIAL